MNKIKKINIVALIVFIITTILVVLNKVEAFDHFVYEKVMLMMSDSMTFFLKMITHSGDLIPVVCICFLLFVLSYKKRELAVLVILSTASAEIVKTIFKAIINKPRPEILRLIDIGSSSYPSGHSSDTTAFYLMFALLYLGYIENKKLKQLAITICTLMPILMGISRVYVGVHYASDVIGGWSLGIVVSLTIYQIYYKYRLKKENN